MSWRNALVAARAADKAGYDELIEFLLTWLPVVTDKSHVRPAFPEHAAYEKQLCEEKWGSPPERPTPLVKFLQARVEHLLKFVHPVPPADAKTVLRYFRCGFRWVIYDSMNVVEPPAGGESLDELDAFRGLVVSRIMEPGARAMVRKRVRDQLVRRLIRPTDNQRQVAEAAWQQAQEEVAGRRGLNDMASLLELAPPLGQETPDAPFLFRAFQLPALTVYDMLRATIALRRALHCVGPTGERMVAIEDRFYPSMIEDSEKRVYMLNDAGTLFEGREGVIPFLEDEHGDPRIRGASVANRRIIDHAYTAYVQRADARSDGLSMGSPADLRSKEDPMDGSTETEEREERPMSVEPAEAPAAAAAEPPRRVGKRAPEPVEADASSDDISTEAPSSDDDEAAAPAPRRPVAAAAAPAPRRPPAAAAVAATVVSAPVAVLAAVPVHREAVPARHGAVLAVPVQREAVPALLMGAPPPTEPKAKAKKAKKVDYTKDFELISAEAWVPKMRDLRSMPNLSNNPGSHWRARWGDMQRHALWRDVDYALHFNVPGDTLLPRLLEYDSNQFPYGREDGHVRRITERILTWLERLLPDYPAWVSPAGDDRRTIEECIAMFEAMMDWELMVEHGFIKDGEFVEAIVRDAMRRQALLEGNPEILANLRREPRQAWQGESLNVGAFRRNYAALRARVPWDGTLPQIASVVHELQMDETGQIDLFEQMSIRMSVVERMFLQANNEPAERPMLISFKRSALNSARESVHPDFYTFIVGPDIVVFDNYEYPAGILWVRLSTNSEVRKPYLLLPDLVSAKGHRVPGRMSFYLRSADGEERAIAFFHDREGLTRDDHLFIATDKNRVNLDRFMFEKGPNRNRERGPMPAPEHAWERERLVKIVPQEKKKKERGAPKEILSPEEQEKADREAKENLEKLYGTNRGFQSGPEDLLVPRSVGSASDEEEEAEAKSDRGAAASAPPPAAPAAPVHVAQVKKKNAPKPPEDQAAHDARIAKALGLK